MPWNRNLIGAASALAAVCLTSGCAQFDVGGGDISSLFQVAKNLWKGSDTVTLEEASAVPYASIGLRLGDSNEIMLVLATDENGQRIWTSSSRIAITTREGRIVRTAGLGHNLGGYESRQAISGPGGPQMIRWQADFPDLGLYSIPIACQNRYVRDETILILGKKIHARRWDESCAARNEQIDWSFHNTYWLDPANGFVWRSIQHIHPQIDAIETEILRPPSSASKPTQRKEKGRHFGRPFTFTKTCQDLRQGDVVVDVVVDVLVDVVDAVDVVVPVPVVPVPVVVGGGVHPGSGQVGPTDP